MYTRLSPAPPQLRCALKLTPAAVNFAKHRAPSTCPPPQPPSLSVTCREDRRMGRDRSCSPVKTKAPDDDALPADRRAAQAEGDGEEGGGAAEQGTSARGTSHAVGWRRAAYEVFGSVYVCIYVLAWRLGELVVVNAQDALEKIRRNALEKFRGKR